MAIAQGICNENHNPNAFWRIDEDGTLVIYGEGSVHINFETPWDGYAQIIKEFKVTSGITHIYVKLKNYANLTKAEFPETLIYEFCEFPGCVNLSEIIIPDSVIGINDRSFEDTAWYKAQPDGVLYIGKVFYGFKGEYSGGSEFTVKDGTLGIIGGSFKVKGIKKVHLPPSIVYVSLSNVTFDDDIENMNIGENKYDFWNWGFSNGTIILNDGMVKSFSSLEERPWHNFRGSIKTVSIPYCNYTEKHIGANAFAECTNLETAELSSELRSIGAGAFKNCVNLRSVTWISGVELIEKGAFSGCRSLTEFAVPQLTDIKGKDLVKFNEKNDITFMKHQKISDVKRFDLFSLFKTKNEHDQNSGCTVGGFGENFTWSLDQYGVMNVYGEGEMPCGEKFFSENGKFDKQAVKKVIFDERITEVGSMAFEKFTELTEIVFPQNLIGINMRAFHECSSLTSVYIPDKTEIIGDNAFSFCTNLKSVRLPDGLKSIWSGAFHDCHNLTDITIPLNTSVGNHVLGRTALEENSPTDVFYHNGRAMGYARESDETVLRLKSGTTQIVSAAFGTVDYDSFLDLTEVILNSELKSIGSYAFSNIRLLEKVIGNCVFSRLGAYIFNGTKWYDDQPDEVIYFQNAVLINKNKELESVKLAGEYGGKKITVIADQCFCYNQKLREAELGENIETIGGGAFDRCILLEKVTIPDSVKSIGSYAFIECPNLKSVYIPPSVTEIGNYAFGYVHNPDWLKKNNAEIYLRSENFTIQCKSGSAAEKNMQTIMGSRQRSCEFEFYIIKSRPRYGIGSGLQ